MIYRKTVMCLLIIMICPLILFTTPNNASGKIQKIEEYKAFLNSLAISRVNTIEEAKQRFLLLFPPNTPNTEEAFSVFRQFHTNVVHKLDQEFYKRRDIQKLIYSHNILKMQYVSPQNLPEYESIDKQLISSLNNDEKKSLNDLYEYGSCGIVIHYGEGDWYISTDDNFYLNEVLTEYSIPIKKYLEFKKTESKESVLYDAGVIVPWDDLRKKIIRHEEFASKHSSLLEVKTELEPTLKRLVHTYLYGSDNTRVTYRSDKAISSFRKFLKLNKNSSYYGAVATRLKELSSNN